MTRARHVLIVAAAFILVPATGASALSLVKWGGLKTGTGHGKAQTLAAGTGVTPSNGTCTGNGHKENVSVSWQGPSTRFTGETYTVTWTETAGGSSGSNGSASVTGSPAAITVKSSAAGVVYSITVTSVLDKWTATSAPGSLTTTGSC